VSVGGARAPRRIIDRLAAWGADVRLGAPVHSIAADHVALSDGQTLASTVTAVVGPLRGPRLPAPGLTDAGGFFTVDATLRSRVESRVFVAGDAVARGPHGLRRNWQLAVRQAVTAADNAVRSLAGQPLVDLDTSKDQRLAKFYLPDVGGSAFLVWNRRLLASGPAARRIRVGFDRKHFAAYVPSDARWRRMPR
jgi:NADH dehydrogenase FAD-containing subunit